MQLIACLLRQFIEEDTLCAPVALAKWVQHIDFAQIVGGTVCELAEHKPTQILFLSKLGKKFLGIAGNVCDVSKLRGAFADFHLSNLASPVVDILN